MIDYSKLQEALYTAFRKAIVESDDGWKSLSWFPRNKQQKEVSYETKPND